MAMNLTTVQDTGARNIPFASIHPPSTCSDPALTNTGITTTLAQFQMLERTASPQDKLNWRFQQALYRAYYDGYVRSRLLYETQLEDQAMATLRDAKSLGSLLAICLAGA